MDDVSYRGLRRRLVAMLVVLPSIPLGVVFGGVVATNAVGLDALGALLGRRFYGAVYVEPWAGVAFVALAVAVGTVAVQAWLRYAVAGGRTTLPRRNIDDRVASAAETVGVDAPAVRCVEVGYPTAFVVSLSPGGRTLVVSDRLRHSLSEAELDAVLVHELAHVRNRDAAVSAVGAGVLLSLVPFALPLVAVGWLHATLPEAIARKLPVTLFTVALGVVAFVPALPYYATRTVLARGCWQYREYVADSAAGTLVDPTVYASALETVRGDRRSRRSLLGIVDGFLLVPFDDANGDGGGAFPFWPAGLQPATDARVRRVREANADDGA